MINKLLNFKVLLLLVSILLLVSLFYWFQYRPTEVRKEFSRSAIETVTKLEGGGEGFVEAYDFIYELCLHNEGLK